MDRDHPPSLVVGTDRHRAADPFCPKCLLGFPRACVCGGWVHADGQPARGPDTAEQRCGWCGADARPAEPLCIAGTSHAPARPDCPACPPGTIAPCVCGGLIHHATDGTRRCDRCGPRWEELDV